MRPLSMHDGTGRARERSRLQRRTRVRSPAEHDAHDRDSLAYEDGSTRVEPRYRHVPILDLAPYGKLEFSNWEKGDITNWGLHVQAWPKGGANKRQFRP